MSSLAAYRLARLAFLEMLGCPQSNGDPFAEFAGVLAHAVLGGTMAESRSQRAMTL
jgi:hypothetical protein